MAKQKVRSTASQRIFVRSAYHMYSLAHKKTLLLGVYAYLYLKIFA